MTEKLYYSDSRLTEFSATVLECEEYNGNWSVLLDKTAFSPEGGGQGSDRGTLGNARVSDVRINDEMIYHITDKPLCVGQAVTGIIDYERRFDFMQQHSAEHIASGIAHRLYGCENVGFHLGEDIVTFDFDKPLNRSQIEKIEELTNETVFKNLPVRAYFPNKNELENIEYRSKKELEGEIRLVEIENTDICACCALHVNFTGEIGIVKLSCLENIRGGVRIELKAGKRALADYKNKCENILRISNSLCVKKEDAAEAVERLLSGTEALKYEITGLKRRAIIDKITAFSDDRRVTAMIADGFGIKELQSLADGLYKAYNGIRGVFSPKKDAYAFVICGESGELDTFFKDFKNSFSLRGGGRNGMVQGTVFADFGDISSFFSQKIK